MKLKIPDRFKHFIGISRRWLAAPVFSNPTQTSIAALLNTLLVSAFFLGFMVVLLQFVFNWVANWNNIRLLFVLLTATAMLRESVHRGHLRPATWLLPLLVWLFISIEIYNLGTIYTARIYGYLLAVTLATFFEGEIAGLLVLALTVISFVVLAQMEAAGFLPAAQPLTDNNQIITFGVLSFEIFFVMLVARRSLLKSLMDTRSELQQRIQAEAALLTINTSLDQRIQERTFELEQEMEKRQQTAAALLRSEEWFRTLADFTYSWEYFLSPDGIFLYVSPHCEMLTGYTPQQFIEDPETFINIIHPDDRQMVVEHTLSTRKNHESCLDFDFRILDKNGQERWIAHVCRPVFDNTGKYLGQRASNRDVTIRKNAELRLRQLSQVVEQSPSSILITDLAGKIEYVNPKFTQVTGYTAEEALGRNPRELLSDDPPEADRILMAALAEGREWRGEFLNHKKNGARFWEAAIITPATNAKNQITHYIHIKDDITSQKNASLRIRQLSQAVEQSPSSIVITNLSGKIEYVNPKFTELTGFSAEEVFNQNPSVLKSGNTSRETYAQLWKTISAGHEWRGEFQNKKKNGELYWESVVIAPVIDDDNKSTHYLAIKEDITERKQIESLLQESEQRFRSLFENSPFAYLSLDWNGCFLDVNDNLCQLMGYSRGELLGKSFEYFWTADTQAYFLPRFQDFKTYGSTHGDIHLRRKDGQILTVLLNGRVQTDSGGHFLRAHCILTNVSERERMQTQLRQQNKSMTALYDSALDFLSNHDLNELFIVLAGHASQLLNAEQVGIMTPEGDVLVTQFTSPHQPFKAGERFDHSQAVLSWQAVDTLQPASVADYSTNQQYFTMAVADPRHVYAAASIPIISRDQCLGVLDIGREKPGLPFTADEIQLAKLFAQISALAIENAKLSTSLLEQAIRDPLTGLHNRRYMFETLQVEMTRSLREKSMLNFILLDIDHFKQINDTYGHGAGDAALKALAIQFQRMVRADDILCRYGGDEHLIVMHNTAPPKAVERADQLRKAIETMEVEYEGSRFRVTISLGISTYPDHGKNIDELIACADKALFTSKKSGRNRVSYYEPRGRKTRQLPPLDPKFKAPDNKN